MLELLTSNEGQVPSLNGEETKGAAGVAAAGWVKSVDACDGCLQRAAVDAGWPMEVAQEVVTLAAACAGPHAERRKSSSVIARALREVVQEELEEAGSVRRC